MILFNDTPYPVIEFSEESLKNGLTIYEVIRILNKQPIFLKDNLMRLDNSLKKSNIDIDVTSLKIPDKLKRLIDLQQIEEGNIKYVLHFGQDQIKEYVYQIPHHYPNAQDYKNGVPTITYATMRANPSVKYLNENLRALTNQLILEHQVYEILLVDNEGFVTEGSRSNVFFIKENKLYTSPLEYVLPGTSRKRVFDICHEHQIPVIEQRINSKYLEEYESAFLTGTSPLILPICLINSIKFSVNTPFLRQLMNNYFDLLKK